MADAPKFTGYFPIVQPQSETILASDNFTSDGTAFNSTTWYQRLLGGSASRMSRYIDYDKMNADIDVARALDLVAEEMSGINQKTGLMVDIVLNSEEGRMQPANLIATLRVALKHWSKRHNLSTTLFQICRKTIQYGDTFFQRKNIDGVDTWIYLNARCVLAALVDEQNPRKVVGWQIRDETVSATPGQAMAPVSNNSQSYQTLLVPAKDIVRFTLSDDMTDLMPFGESVLSSVFRTQRQKEMLEDAIIIYRVQRAPERRVFYVDVGKMPPQRTKQYLEQVKNDMRQKKVPAMGPNGNLTIDSQYNPQSMSEDFFFAQRANGAGTKVETLPAGQNLGELTDLEYFRNKVLEGLRIPPSFLPSMQTGQNVATFNDGNVGTAYLPEIQFYKYVMRLQSHINATLDLEFKRFLKTMDINIDESLYQINLIQPTNYDLYRQSAIDSNLLNQFGNADGVAYLSKRFILSRYLRLSADEIAMNETYLMQERGLTNAKTRSLVTLYNPDMMDIDHDEDAAGGMVGGMSGGDMGGMPPSGDDFADDVDEELPEDGQDDQPDDEEPSPDKL